jgi:hypothetical protein
MGGAGGGDVGTFSSETWNRWRKKTRQNGSHNQKKIDANPVEERSASVSIWSSSRCPGVSCTTSTPRLWCWEGRRGGAGRLRPRKYKYRKVRQKPALVSIYLVYSPKASLPRLAALLLLHCYSCTVTPALLLLPLEKSSPGGGRGTPLNSCLQQNSSALIYTW